MWTHSKSVKWSGGVLGLLSEPGIPTNTCTVPRSCDLGISRNGTRASKLRYIKGRRTMLYLRSPTLLPSRSPPPQPKIQGAWLAHPSQKFRGVFGPHVQHSGGFPGLRPPPETTLLGRVAHKALGGFNSIQCVLQSSPTSRRRAVGREIWQEVQGLIFDGRVKPKNSI